MISQHQERKEFNNLIFYKTPLYYAQEGHFDSVTKILFNHHAFDLNGL